METKLARIADKSRNEKRPIFTSLYHLINEDLLKECHKELDGSKAVGIDNVSKKEYAENLNENIKGLVIRLKNKAYKPAPSLRVYIPKGNGFFDHINHNWMIKFLEYNIKDPNIIGLIKKYLKVGIMDKGQYVSTEEGSAQGNIISPVLANIYMHFVLVLWYKEIVQKRAKGDTFLVVYADDFIAGFQYKYEAEAYYEALKERMSKFGLELEESKSRLLEFGRYAEVENLVLN